MRKWTPLLAVCLGSFMLLVDVTIVNVALPKMAVDLRASFTSLQWVIDIYAIGLAALLLGTGALADRVGRRVIYVAGLALFAVSSLAAGLAPDTPVLIAARGIQGLGAAAMFATTIALINASYTGRDRGLAFGAWGAVNGAAAAAGPILGGLLTQALSWRWIFFVNLPISVAAVAMSMRSLPRDRGTSGPRIDLAGVAAFTVAAGSLTYALTRAPVVGWTATATLGLLAAATVALIAFAVIQLRSSNPTIELGLLRRPAFSGVLLGSLLLAVAAFSYFPFMSLWFQSVRGMSPIGAGLAMVPLSVAALVTSLLIGRVLHASSPRILIGGGLALIGVGALLEAHLHPSSDWSAVTLGLVVAGIGVGLASPTVASAALQAVPVDRGGMAAGAVNTMRQLGYALGIAALGAICQSQISDVLRAHHVTAPTSLAVRLVGGQAQAVLAHAPGPARVHLDAAIHAAFASGLNSDLLVGGAIGIAAATLVVATVRGRAGVAAAQPAVPVREPA
jgi:EmrB/QacA subfamily drug resistance transporter